MNMKRRLYLLLLFVFVLGGSLSGYGQPTSSSTALDPGTVSAPIYFQMGKSTIDPVFMDNRERMDFFTKSLREILANPDYVVNKVRVVGMASPDGLRERNLELAGARARSLADFLIRETGISEDKIDIVNGGENWAGLFSMIEASTDVPDKEKMLEFRDTYGKDYDALKRSMQYYNDSRAWKFMYQHFFPILRTGAGAPDSDPRLSSLSISNWQRLREVIQNSDFDEESKLKMLAVISQAEIENRTDAGSVITQLRALCPDDTVYTHLVCLAVDDMLSNATPASKDNWSLLYKLIETSDMQGKEEVLRIIDESPIDLRESKLRDWQNYNQVAEVFYPLLLTSEVATMDDDGAAISLSAENWKKLRAMILQSNMPNKEGVLAIIDGESDLAVRVRKLYELDGGYPYRYIREVFFPVLLYDLSASSKENWLLVEDVIRKSDLPNRDQVLEVLLATSSGAEREKAIRALDDSHTWNIISRQIFTALLQNTDPVSADSSGAGMSFSFELNPAAKARAEELKRQQEEQLRQEAEARLAEQRRLEEERLAEQHRREEEQRRREEEQRRREEEQRRREEEAAREAARLAVIEHRKLKASAALKTDFVLWGSLMPGFEMGSFMPNLSAEAYFARRWSVQLGGGYCNWDALGGDYGLYAVTGIDLEPRFWLKNDALYRGLYFGVFGTCGDFDLQKATTGYTGTYFMAGVTGGWCQVLGRHLYLEAALRLGFRSAQGDNYTILNGHYYWDSSENRSKFAPQVRLQLVYRFGKSGK